MYYKLWRLQGDTLVPNSPKHHFIELQHVMNFLYVLPKIGIYIVTKEKENSNREMVLIW